MSPIRLPDPFEPLRCLRRSGEPAAPPGACPLLLRGQAYLLPADLLTRSDGHDTLALCEAVRTALRRVVVQRPRLGRCGFDQAWERALWVDGEQTYKLWRGLRHAEVLFAAERREAASPLLPDARGRDEGAVLGAARAMLLGELELLGESARAALPGGEWEPFQLGRVLEAAGQLGPSLSSPPPYSTGLIFSRLSPPAYE